MFPLSLICLPEVKSLMCAGHVDTLREATDYLETRIAVSEYPHVRMSVHHTLSMEDGPSEEGGERGAEVHPSI